MKGRLCGIRLGLFLAVVVAFFLFGVKDARAADIPTISSPTTTSDLTVGEKVTIKAKPKSALHLIQTYYIYFKVTKDGNRILYEHKKAQTMLSEVTQEFTPEVEGKYQIEICEIKDNDALAYDAFQPEDSVTVTVRRDISREPAATVSGLKDEVFTGSGITQTPTVQLADKTLDPDTDYDISYENNVNVGKATIKITGKGFYKGTVTGTFNITPKDLSGATVSGLVEKEFDRKEKTQSPTVVLDGRTLQAGSDYDLSYENNVNAGTATVNINGKGNYEGRVSKTFKITPLSISECTISTLTDWIYNGKPRTQNNLLVTYDGNLEPDKDYTVSYKDNIKPGTATMTITGKGNFKGSVVRTFYIKEFRGKDEDGGYYLESPESGAYYKVGDTVPLIGVTRTHTGSAYTPNYFYVRVTKGGKTLRYQRYVFYDKGMRGTFPGLTVEETGEYMVEFTVKGNHDTLIPEEDFTADCCVTFTVGTTNPSERIDISQATVTGIDDKEYTGNAITQSPVLKMNGTTLKNGTDYYVTHDFNVNVGKAVITIYGKGKYKGSLVQNFQILPRQLTESMITLSPAEFEYTGTVQKPAVVVKNGEFRLVEGKDYKLTNAGGTEPGEYEVTISKGTGTNYDGEARKKFYIGRLSLDKASVTYTPSPSVYDGTAKKPALTVKLGDTTIPADSYDAVYSNNINAGKGKVTITAKAENPFYKGSLEGTFDIEPLAIRDERIGVGPIAALTYNGKAQTPKPFVSFAGETLKENTDYTLTYSNHTNAGQATMKIVGKGNFKEIRVVTFTIDKKDINDASIIVDPITSQQYEEGSTLTPDVVVKDGNTKLTADDFSLEYKDNDKVGTATVTIKGKGNYTGSRETTFDILEKNDYAVYQLTEKVNELDSMDTSEYLPADKEALQAAIDHAKELLADGNASIEDLENALAKINEAKDTADTNLAIAKAEEEARKKAEQEAAAAREKARKEAEKKEALSKPAAAAVEKKVLAQKNDKDPAGSAYLPLQLKSSKQTKNTNVLTWKKVPGTTKYVVYGNPCGKGIKLKKLATVKGASFVHKKLKKGTYYKYVVIAVKKTAYGERANAVSTMIHVATKGGKVTNHKKIIVKIKKGKKKKTVKKVTIKKGKKQKLLADATPASKKLRVSKHVVIRYESSNPKTAVVDKKGVIKGVKKGTCFVYIYAQNGVQSRIKVTVK